MGEVIRAQFRGETTPSATPAQSAEQGWQDLQTFAHRTQEALAQFTGVANLQQLPVEQLDAILATFTRLHKSYLDIARRKPDETTDPALITSWNQEVATYARDTNTFVQAIADATGQPSAPLAVAPAPASTVSQEPPKPWFLNPWVIGGVTVGATALLGAIMWYYTKKKPATALASLSSTKRRTKPKPRRKSTTKKLRALPARAKRRTIDVDDDE